MGIKKWVIREAKPQAVQKLTKTTNLSSLNARLAAAKGLETTEDIRAFFGEDTLSDPYLMADMYAAVERIRGAVEREERIAVYGDYDCDGVTATAMLYSYLQCCGADVISYIPEREGEGYGLSELAVRRLKEQGVILIITVDNGISAHREAELIAELGMELVITDHHQPSEELPHAVAIVNPHRRDCPSPFKPLAGVGVALKLICALEDGDWDTVLEQYGDLAAIGTIGDIVRLTGENRSLVQVGLRMLAVTENIGLMCLMEACKINPDELTTTRVAFSLVPRINAAGRFGSARQALELLLCENDEEGTKLAEALCALNGTRQEIERNIIAEIEQKIAANPALLNQRVLILWGEGWHQGVIGIVSSKLVERYGKPNVLLAVNDDAAHGSARSIGDFSLFSALTACKEHLIRYGGHTKAAGMTVATTDIPAFCAAMLAYAAKEYPQMPAYAIEADLSLSASEITVENIEGLSLFEPFGEGNPSPVFAIQGAVLEGIQPLKDGKYVRLRLKQEGSPLYAVCFDRGSADIAYPLGTKLDLLVMLEINEYNGKRSPSIRIRDLRVSGFEQDKYFAAKAVYEQFKCGEAYDQRLKAKIVPSREDIGMVYKLLKSRAVAPIDTLFELLHTAMNYCKLRLILDILSELELVHIDAALQTASVDTTISAKADLESSKLLQTLKTS